MICTTLFYKTHKDTGCQLKSCWHDRNSIELIRNSRSIYKVNQLVYYETHGDITEAIKREKNIQAWKRNWKLNLIEKNNPYWNDLYNSIL